MQYIYLIMVLSFTLAGDSLFNLAIIWRVLEHGGSAKTLGFFLCLMMLVTFALQEGSSKFKRMLQIDPQKSFAWVRMLGVMCSLIFLPLLWNESIAMLYLSGAVFTVLSFLTMITVEAIMGQEVLQRRLSSNKASRILQTAVQTSAFLGASIAGIVLSLGNMKGVLLVNAVTYLSGALFFLLLKNHVQSNSNNETSTQSAFDKKQQSANFNILLIALIGLIVLTFQVSAFNFLVPLISQHEKAWTATEFGYIDAAAGLGAFLCSLIVTEKGYLSYTWILTFAIILAGNSLFHYVNNIYVIVLASACMGFAIGAFRIKLREFVYDSVSNTNEIIIWTGRITATSYLIKAIVPLILAFLTLSPSLNFMLCGLFVSISFLIIEIGYFIILSLKKRKVSIEEAIFNSLSK